MQQEPPQLLAGKGVPLHQAPHTATTGNHILPVWSAGPENDILAKQWDTGSRACRGIAPGVVFKEKSLMGKFALGGICVKQILGRSEMFMTQTKFQSIVYL